MARIGVTRLDLLRLNVKDYVRPAEAHGLGSPIV